jgi:CRISPR-associated protein Cas6
VGGTPAGVTTVDMAFAVTGERLPRDHALELFEALAREAPGLAAQAALAVLGIRAASAGELGLALGRHSRLLLRLPDPLVEGALALCGRSLEIAGSRVTLGSAKTRPLAPHATLYAHRVAAEGGDEASFVVQAARELEVLGVRSEFIVGKRSTVRGPAGRIEGFSLMLADLAPRQSLALQAFGIGAHRRLGFGIFVGHK